MIEQFFISVFGPHLSLIIALFIFIPLFIFLFSYTLYFFDKKSEDRFMRREKERYRHSEEIKAMMDKK